MHETGFGYSVRWHGQLPKDRSLLQKHLLIREHISHCLWTLMSLAATKGRKTKTRKSRPWIQKCNASTRGAERTWQPASSLICLIWIVHTPYAFEVEVCAPPPPLNFSPPMFLPSRLCLSHYCYCRDQSQGTILQRTLWSLISSFRDMALLTSLVALMPLEGLKCHLSLAEQPRTVQNVKYLSG